MKTFNKILAVIAVTALFAAGCVNEEPNYKKDGGGPEKPAADGKGYLSLGNLGLRVIFDNQTETQPDDTDNETQRPSSRTTRTEPAVGDFLVDIYDAENVAILSTTYAELQEQLSDKPLELAVGSYRIEVRSDAVVPDVAWERPTYGGSQTFSILKGQTKSIDEVVCTLTNIKVTLMCSADLAAHLDTDPAVTKATVSLGETKANIAVGETKAVYFRAQEQVNTLGFALDGKFADGEKVKFSKTISNVKAGQWRKITLVIAYADKGDIQIDIKVDNFVQDEEIVVDGSSGWNEAIYEEEPEIDPSAPTITWPGHNLAEPFQLNASMFDEQNNCTVPFRFDLKSPNGIDAFVISINSTNQEFMSSLETILGINSEFDLCTLSSGHPAYNWLKSFGFPLGDDLKGHTQKSFDIREQMPLLYGFEGTHTFAFTMTDANKLTTSARLTIIVDKSSEGQAPVIEWIDHDISQVYELENNMTVRVEIAAPAGGIKSLLVKIDSKKLGEMLDAANAGKLKEQFDLCTIDGDEANFLKETVGFPVGSDVRDQTAIAFEISSLFTGLLKDFDPEVAGQPNMYKFHLEVIDNQGNTSKAVLQLIQPTTTK